MIILLVLLPAGSFADSQNHNGSVLILNSYHPGYIWTDQEVQGIIEVLRSQDSQIEPYIEYMDYDRHPTREYLEHLTSLYQEKYTGIPISVVITTDDPALLFAIEKRQSLFDGAPVAFCGVSRYNPVLAADTPDIAGVVENVNVTDTLQEALVLQPSARDILIILDDTENSLWIRKELEQVLPGFSQRAAIIVTQNISSDQLPELVAQVPSDGIIILGTFTRDPGGKVIPHEKILKIIQKSSRAPIFSFWSYFAGKGILGGTLTDGVEEGRNAARLADRLVAGERSIPPVYDHGDEWNFDYRELSRFNINEKILPDNSWVLNRPIPMHEQYFGYIVGACIVIITLIVIIILLVLNVRTRKKSEMTLRAAHDDLNIAYSKLEQAGIQLQQQLASLEQSRRELAESEERYRNAVENQTEFISRFLPDGTHVFVNEAYCRYFGVTREYVIGSRFAPTIHPGDRKDLERHFSSLTPDNPVQVIEHRIIMPDGRVRWHRWSDRGLFNSEGQVTEYQSVGTDVTDRKKAEAALVKATEKLTLFNSINQNDIQNHLFTILGYLELARTQPLPAEIDGFFEKMQIITQSMRRTVEFMKDYHGLGIHPPQWQDVEEVYLYALSHLDTTGFCRTGTLGGIEIYADPLLERVFYNLLENSLRHSGTGRTLMGSWYEVSGDLHILIEDDGTGIPDERKEKIFKRQMGKGTGNGLFLAREILSITGIAIQETGVAGKGARFEIIVLSGSYRLKRQIV